MMAAIFNTGTIDMYLLHEKGGGLRIFFFLIQKINLFRR